MHLALGTDRPRGASRAWWAQAALLVAAGPALADEGTTTVLLLPLEAGPGIDRPRAEMLTAMVALEASTVPGFRLVTLKEVEQTLDQERLRQVAGCSTVACALEIAGSLNAQQLVVGTVGQVGSEEILSLTRLDARTATVLGRSGGRFPAGEPHRMADALRGIVSSLMGTPLPSSSPRPAPAPPLREPARGRSPLDLAWPAAALLAVVAGAGVVVNGLVTAFGAVTTVQFLQAGSSACWWSAAATGAVACATCGTGLAALAFAVTSPLAAWVGRVRHYSVPLLATITSAACGGSSLAYGTAGCFVALLGMGFAQAEYPNDAGVNLCLPVIISAPVLPAVVLLGCGGGANAALAAGSGAAAFLLEPGEEPDGGPETQDDVEGGAWAGGG